MLTHVATLKLPAAERLSISEVVQHMCLHAVKHHLRLSPVQQCIFDYLETHGEVSGHELRSACHIGNLSDAVLAANRKLAMQGEARRVSYRKLPLPGSGWEAFWRLEDTGRGHDC